MTALLYIMNVLCSAGQSALGKAYAKHGGDSFTFNISKAAAGTLLFLLVGLLFGFSFHMPTVCFGLAYGAVLCLSMHTGFKALSLGPMALTSVIASFSLLIPFGVGIFLWHEPMTVWKGTGLALLLLAIWLVNAKRESGFSVKWLFYAGMTMLTNGACAVIQKMHQMRFPGQYRTEFMFWALLCVLLLLSAGTLAKGKETHPCKASLPGSVSGIMNCAANYIVLYLSATENASVIFPILSAANIMTVFVIGIFVFGEKLKKLQLCGLLTGVIAVVFLKL